MKQAHVFRFWKLGQSDILISLMNVSKGEKTNEKKLGKYLNKAGYTATSCGRVGRSGNARFHTFRLVLTDGPTDRPTDGRTDGQSLL